MNNQVFVETENVVRFRQAMNVLSDIEHGQPGIGMFWGRAGRGKSMAALSWYAQNGGVFFPVWEDLTQFQFMQRLCHVVCGIRPSSTMAAKEAIVTSLERARRVVIIDEADRLNAKRLNDLRDIHEATGASIALVGEEELIGLVGSQRRLWSRVSQEEEFRPVSDDDIMLFALKATGLEFSAEACREVNLVADGDFRLVRNAVQRIEKAASAREIGRIEAKLVKSLRLLSASATAVRGGRAQALPGVRS